MTPVYSQCQYSRNPPLGSRAQAGLYQPNAAACLYHHWYMGCLNTAFLSSPVPEVFGPQFMSTAVPVPCGPRLYEADPDGLMYCLSGESGGQPAVHAEIMPFLRIIASCISLVLYPDVNTIGCLPLTSLFSYSAYSASRLSAASLRR